MNRVINFLKKNYAPLLASFFLALLLWIAVITDKMYNRTISIPLNINRLASGYVLSERPPDKVLIEVSGKGRALFGMNFYKSTLDLELPELKKSSTINLKDYQSRFHIPRNLGIEIVDILEPRSIDLKIDKFSEKELPIRVNANIKPQPGYVLTQTSSQPTKVSIAGPASILDGLSFIQSDSIGQQNVTYPFTKTIKLVNPHPGITSISTEKIIVSFEIEQLVERTMYNIPIQLVGIPSDYTAKAVPASVTIHIKGSEKNITAIQLNHITALFNYHETYENGKTLYPVSIELPKNVELLKISPDQFRLTLKRIEEES